ncbi:MAG: ABC transporter permease [Candidatus Binatia bacterium]
MREARPEVGSNGRPVNTAGLVPRRLRRMLRLLRPLIDDGRSQLAAEWRRHVLTLVGIVWGSAAVVVLLASGAGFYAFVDTGFKKTGDRHSFVVGEYTTAETGGARLGRPIHLTRDDLDRLRAGVPSAQVLAAGVTRGTVAVRTVHRTRNAVVAAVTPDLQYIQELHVGRGRFFDADDDRSGRAVAVLGANLPSVFFGTDDVLGRTIEIEGKPFQLVVLLCHKTQGAAWPLVFRDAQSGR